MKKILYTMAIVGLGILTTAKAQVSIGVSIGAPVYAAPMPAPVWIPQGPQSAYYFFPDINCYYDMGIGQYIYLQNNNWVYSRAIPPMYRGYNFRRARIMPMSRTAFGYRGIPRYNAPMGPMTRNGMMMDRRNNMVMQNRPPMNGNRGGWNNGNHNGWNNGNHGGGNHGGWDERGRGGRR